jgi:hypothetical protein
VGPMAEVVEHILGILPPDGPIEGTHLLHIWTLARTLANEKAAEEAAAIAMQMSSPSLAFEDMLAKSSDTVSAPAEAAATAPAPTVTSPSPVVDSSMADGQVAVAEDFSSTLGALF